MSLFGPPKVEKLKAKGDVQGLIKALNYKKNSRIDLTKASPQVRAKVRGYVAVREAAAKALGELGDTRAVEPLGVALKHGNVGQAAVAALGQIGNAQAVDLLIAALEDRFKWEAAEALGKIGDARAVEPLTALLKGEKYAHGMEIVLQALGQINDPRIVQILIVFITKRIDALEKEENLRENHKTGKSAVTVLQKVLEARAPSVAENDLYAITQLKSAEIHVSGSTCSASYHDAYQVSCLQLQQLARQELIRRGLEA